MTTGADDIAVATFTILHAVGMYKKYLRAGRIAHAEKAIKKLMNEFVNKEKVQAIQPILDAIASSQTGGQFHVIRSTTANQVTLNDFNRLMTKVARVIKSGTGSTPVEGTPRRITDMIGSPEFVEQIRSIAYQPVNTRTVDGTAGTPAGSSTAMPAHERLRESIYDASGIPSIYGVGIVELTEMGVGQDFNTIFDTFAGSNAYEGYAGSSTAQFDGAAEELVVCVNRGLDNLIKVKIADGETGDTFEARPTIVTGKPS